MALDGVCHREAQGPWRGALDVRPARARSGGVLDVFGRRMLVPPWACHEGTAPVTLYVRAREREPNRSRLPFGRRSCEARHAMDVSPALSPRWTVVDYEGSVLAHRVTLKEALDIVLSILAEVCDWGENQHYWPLFSLSRDPIADVEETRQIEGGLHRTGGLSDKVLETTGIVVDIRDAAKSDPALDIHGAAESIYEAFRNMDLCYLAYRDMPLVFNPPADRVNHVAIFDPALERHLCERYAGPLAEGAVVHAALERTRLSHIDELHMWVVRQIFYFHACKLGRYKEPDQVYGFSGSPLAKNMVLAWGCAPHAHEMAWGIAYGVEQDLKVGSFQPERAPAGGVRLEPRFIEQVEALLVGSSPARKTTKGTEPKDPPQKTATKAAVSPARKTTKKAEASVAQETAKKAEASPARKTTKKIEPKEPAPKKAPAKKGQAKRISRAR